MANGDGGARANSKKGNTDGNRGKLMQQQAGDKNGRADASKMIFLETCVRT